MNDLTLVIPAKFESGPLPQVIRELQKYNCKILVSLQEDDLETINAIQQFNIQIHKQSGAGYGNSLIEGIQNCNTKYFCIFNADGSFDNTDLSLMYKMIKQNDFIFTSRYEKNAGSEDDTLVTFIGNKVFSLIGRILFSLKISDILFTYIMGNTNSFKKLNIRSNDFRFCVELPIKMHLAKMKYQTLPSYEKKRISGVKKVSAFKDGFLILIEILILFFMYKIFRNQKK
jgi:glycosyltransferase involved in cell wall biosynthesis